MNLLSSYQFSYDRLFSYLFYFNFHKSATYIFRLSKNGDIIFARITPCLEHGKTAKVDNLTDSRGFGSTEFFVLRSRDGISDPDYIYYLACSPEIREPAIKSIIGASGRQRAQKTVIENTIVRVPEIEEQQRIASILSAYDDLIENNRRRIKLLEESARLLYREWFVHLRFPSHENVKIIDGVPEGWEKKKIAEVTDTYGGGTPSTKISEYWVGGKITRFIPKDLTNNDCLVLLDSEKKITEEGLKKSSAKMLPTEAILMTSRASIGYFGLYDGAACTNQGFISIVSRKDLLKLYLLHNLMDRKEEILSRAGGTTYKEINKNLEARAKTIGSRTLLSVLAPGLYDGLQLLEFLYKHGDVIIKTAQKVVDIESG